MSIDCFLDTNVLVYAATGRRSEERKRKTALDLIAQQDFALSAQVLQEFFVTVTRKIEVPMTAEEALEWIEQFDVFPCLAIDRAMVKTAIEIKERYQISYWDAAVAAAAEAVGAAILYSEDLSDAQRYGSVTVRNPFRAS